MPSIKTEEETLLGNFVLSVGQLCNVYNWERLLNVTREECGPGTWIMVFTTRVSY